MAGNLNYSGENLYLRRGYCRAEGHVLWTKAGALADGDFTQTAIDGLAGFDTTNRLLYVRVNGSWIAAAPRAPFPTKTVAASNASSTLGADYVCDGTADNVEIQAALDALPAGGGTIQLTDGLYTVAASVDIPSKCRLIGAGRIATMVKQANTANVPVIRSKLATSINITISDLTVDGNLANQSSSDLHGIMLGRNQNTGGSGHRLYNVLAQNCRASGICIYSCSDVELRGCFGLTCTVGSGAAGNGIYLCNCQDSRVLSGGGSGNANAGVLVANHTLTPGNRACSIIGGHYNSNAFGMECDDGTDDIFLGNEMLNNTVACINLFGSNHLVASNLLRACPIGLKLNGTVNTVIEGNQMVSITLGIQNLSSSTVYEAGNVGSNAISRGTGTVLLGQTASAAITHAFPGTPLILLQGLHAETALIIPTSIGATTFVGTVPSGTTADRTFNWWAFPPIA